MDTAIKDSQIIPSIRELYEIEEKLYNVIKDLPVHEQFNITGHLESLSITGESERYYFYLSKEQIAKVESYILKMYELIKHYPESIRAHVCWCLDDYVNLHYEEIPISTIKSEYGLNPETTRSTLGKAKL